MIALFQHQLGRQFWFYKLWYTSYIGFTPNLANAAVTDLEMWNNLNDLVLLSPQQIGKYPGHFKEMLATAQQKLNNHYCCLTKRHIVFGLANDRIVKIQMINKLMSFRSSSTPAAVIGNGLVWMPILQKSTHLPDLIGLDSFAFFCLFWNPQFDILTLSNPMTWHGLEEFESFKTLFQN